MRPDLGDECPRDPLWIYESSNVAHGSLNPSHAQAWRTSLYRIAPQELLDQAREDIEFEASFCMIAAVEGLLRVDFYMRSDSKIINDPYFNPRFQSMLANETTGRKTTARDIIDVWQEAARQSNRTVLVERLGKFRATFGFRNWFAHGRSWETAIKHPCDRLWMFFLATELVKELESFRPDLSLAKRKVWPR